MVISFNLIKVGKDTKVIFLTYANVPRLGGVKMKKEEDREEFRTEPLIPLTSVKEVKKGENAHLVGLISDLEKALNVNRDNFYIAISKEAVKKPITLERRPTARLVVYKEGDKVWIKQRGTIQYGKDYFLSKR